MGIRIWATRAIVRGAITPQPKPVGAAPLFLPPPKRLKIQPQFVMTSMTLNGPVCKCKAASFRMREKTFVQLAAVDALEERKQRAREEERRERGSRK